MGTPSERGVVGIVSEGIVFLQNKVFQCLRSTETLVVSGSLFHFIAKFHCITLEWMFGNLLQQA